MVNKKIESLTERELKTLQMLSSGMLNKQIAYEMKISEVTVKAHVSNTLRKLGASNRVGAALIFLRHLNPNLKTRARRELIEAHVAIVPEG